MGNETGAGIPTGVFKGHFCLCRGLRDYHHHVEACLGFRV